MQNDDRPASVLKKDVAACLLAVAAVFMVYAPELTFQRAFFYFDLSSLSLPSRQWAFERLAVGDFPEWCRHWGAGGPFVGESQSGVLYPPNYAVYTWLPGWKALAVAFGLHLVAAALGCYVLFRRWCTPTAALFGALLYALGGRMAVHQIHTPFVEVLAWTPWILAALDRWCEADGRRFLLAAVGLTA
ncbi:MAG: hypothetical protein ACRDD1_08000, partial [Planctomycetia bacterium]